MANGRIEIIEAAQLGSEEIFELLNRLVHVPDLLNLRVARVELAVDVDGYP